MTQALWIAKTGLDAQQTRMAVVSNNLANVNTTGFKQGRAMFEDLLYQNVRQPGANNTQDATLPSGVTLGTGVRVVSTEKMFTQGSVVNTDRDLDVMINGRGFFEITRPDGTAGYTRDGSFQLDAQGQLVTSSGYALTDGITIPADAQSITIGVDGTVTVSLPGQASPSQVGQIQVTTFPNPGGLQPIGENLFVETASSGSPSAGTAGDSGNGSLQQGALEGSNVNVVSELVSMIETQRAYEMNSKAISTTDQMMQYVNNNL
ncbi:MAG: flagellar basal-body rod protein FlgG [Woeseiaceae bacterium]|nr:flagellar basal-body rod protein FlgG [Woeseiaceae bacterium]